MQPGEILKIDTGCIVAFTQTVSYDIQFVGGIKNTIFGGEEVYSLHNYKVRESLDSRRFLLADWQAEFYNMQIITEEKGSVLGKLGNMLDGDGF